MFFVEDVSKLTNMHSYKQQAEDKFLNSLFIFHATASTNKQNTMNTFWD